MSLERQIAMLWSSIGFLVIGVPCYFHTQNPLQVIFYGGAGAVVLWILGHKVGTILANPLGRPVRDNTPSFFQRLLAPPGKEALVSAKSTSSGGALAGEETFLDDIGS